jgi:hypothetical protein
MELLPWINPNLLNSSQLQLNPNAIDYIVKHNIPLDYDLLSTNKNASSLLENCNISNLNFYYIVCNKNVNIFFIQKLKIHNDKKIFLPFTPCHYNDYTNELLWEREDILKIVSKFEYNLLGLCKNLNIQLLKIVQEHIHSLTSEHWYYLSMNPSAVPILKQHINKIDWWSLCSNPCEEAIQLLETSLEKINWHRLSVNYYAVDLLIRNSNRIDWYNFSKNTNPKAIEFMKLHIDKICWTTLSSNPSAISILKNYLDKIDWINLSGNPSAIDLLQQNQDKICWIRVSRNPSIFQYNYLKMTLERSNKIRGELLQVSLHPSRISYWLTNGMTIHDL